MQVPSFSVSLPEGFVELPRESEPSAERLVELAQEWQAALGVPNPGELTEGSLETAAMLAATGTAAAVAGSTHTSAALYRSPEAARPIMVLVNLFTERTDHEAVSEALELVQKLSTTHSFDRLERVSLPAGESIVTETSHAGRHESPIGPVTLTTRSLSAWIPAPHLPETVVIEVSSNNAEDWSHVAGLARRIFDTFTWEEE